MKRYLAAIVCGPIVAGLITGATPLYAQRGAEEDFDAAPQDGGRGGRGRDRGGDPGGAPGEDGGGRGFRGGRGGFGGMGGGRGGFPNPLFDALDINKDGEINANELKRAAQNLKKLDRDGDGVITQDETRPDASQMADRFFTQMDQNGDGMITPDEAPQGGPGVQMLQSADENGDGAVSKDEYAKAMEQFRGRFGGGPGGGGFGPGGPGGGGPGGFGGGGPGGFNGQGMMGRLMQADQNGDGKLSPQEVPRQFMGALQGADQNNDGQLDAREIEMAMRAGGAARAGAAGGPGAGNDNGGGPGGPPGRGRRSYDRFNSQ